MQHKMCALCRLYSMNPSIYLPTSSLNQRHCSKHRLEKSYIFLLEVCCDIVGKMATLRRMQSLRRLLV